jgi:hypothetical protein
MGSPGLTARCPGRLTAPVSAGVCAVHAVMLGGESPPSRWTWSRRTREAPGRQREVGSEGSVERMCGARDTHRRRGMVQPGRAGTQPQSPPSTTGRCLIHPASRHGRDDSVPREICEVSCEGLRAEPSSLTTSQKSADGRVGPAQAKLVRHPKAERRGNGEAKPQRGWAERLNGGQEAWPVVEQRDGIRRGAGRAPGIWDEPAARTPGPHAPVGVMAHPE